MNECERHKILAEAMEVVWFSEQGSKEKMLGQAVLDFWNELREYTGHQICGHSKKHIVSSEEGTCYCSACELESRLDELERKGFIKKDNLRRRNV